MHAAKQRGALQVTVCNTPGAQSTRIADGTVFTRCGPEIGVASSKTLTASMVALYLLACHMGRARGAIDHEREAELVEPLAHLPELMGAVLKQSESLEDARAHVLPSQQNFLFPRPRHAVPRRDGGSAEAEGAELHPRRGLSRRAR